MATKTTMAPQTATMFVDNSVMPYGILEYPLTDNGLQFFSKFSSSISSYPDTKLLMTTPFHTQTNEQPLSYNKTITTQLPHYVNEHQAFCNLWNTRTTAKCIAWRARLRSV